MTQLMVMGLLLCGWSQPCLAALVDFNQVSDPPGIVSSTGEATLGEWTATVTAPATSGNLRFYGWYDQYTQRYADIHNAAQNPAPVLVLEAMTMTARYMDQNVDTDSDTIPDWFEWRYYGDLDEDADSDTDHDGFNLYDEWRRGFNPHSADPTSYYVSEASLPAGIFAPSQVVFGPAGTAYTTSARYGVSGTDSFAYWSLNGVRQIDSLGRGLDPVLMAIQDPTRTYEFAAHFVGTLTDSDGDNTPDRYELNYYGDLGQPESADPDGDGWNLAVEAAHDTHPGLSNRIVQAEVIKATSQAFDFNRAVDFTYSELSDPPGLIDNEYTLLPSTVVTSTAAWSYGDYRFAQWTLNGVAQSDGNGAALNPLVFVITNDAVAVAHLVLESVDSDGDRVADWFEWRYYGDLDEDADTDTDHDGFNLYDEWRRGFNPHSADPTSYYVSEASLPAGIFAPSQVVFGPAGTAYTTSARYGVSGTDSFAYWSLNGVRQIDSLGRGLDPVLMAIQDPTRTYEFAAHFVGTLTDSDGDNTPDRYELNYYGDLGQPESADPDGDGWNLAVEAAHDTHPGLSNRIVQAEVIKATSQAFDFNRAVDFTYSELSDPPGLIDNEYTLLPSTVVTSTAAWSYGDYRFAQWDLNGVAQTDGNGAAVNPLVFTITTDSVAVAHLVLENEDSDGDGVADWYEMYYYGDLDEDTASDTDGDGFDLYEEWSRGFDPHSADPTSYYASESSLPAGVFDLSELIVGATGTHYSTSSRYGISGQESFAQWTMNGVRQSDLRGRAIDPAGARLQEPTRSYRFVAQYVGTTNDVDGDGVPDWYELNYYGDLSHAGADDPDGDGWNLAVESSHDTHPGLDNEIIRRDVIKATSGTFDFWQRSYFPTLPRVLVDGVLTNIFSPLPPANGALNLGLNSAPGLGDWDGDGDLDLFATARGAGLIVYENIGSLYNMNLSERSGAFALAASSGALGDGSSDPTLSLGDVNGDGIADLAIGDGAGNLRIFSSAGSFTAPWGALDISLATGSATAIPALGDVTVDGRVDLLALLADGTVRVYPNSGNPALPFAAATYRDDLLGAEVPNVTGLAVADVDLDGRQDVLVSDLDGRVWAFYGRAGGSYALLSKVWGGTYPGFAARLTIAVGDWDADGDIDMVGGYAQGGLVFLEDPRLASPLQLAAYGGANSIRLTWFANREYRLDGYFIYRSTSETSGFAKLFATPTTLTEFSDTHVVSGMRYYYYVVSVSDERAHGATEPDYLESPPSRSATATAGQVHLWLADYSGAPGQNAILQIGTENARGIAGAGLQLAITYDPAVMVPLSQVEPGAPSVRQTALTAGLVTSNDGATCSGELTITGQPGSTLDGEGSLFEVIFRINPLLAEGATSSNTFSTVMLRDGAGTALPVDTTDTALFTAAAAYLRGDLTADGVVDMTDVRLVLALAVDMRAATAWELRTGDLNGNGRLDWHDAHLIQAIAAATGLAAEQGLARGLAVENGGYALSMGLHEGEAGQTVLIPLSLDNAAGVASVALQVNYSPSVLEVLGVSTNGTLAGAFALGFADEGGSIRIALARKNGLISGTGTLLNLIARVNPGAVPGTGCDLVIASCKLGGEQGVDLAWSSTVSHQDGYFWVVMSRTTDSDGDGLSDYAEQMLDGSYEYDPGGADTDIHNPDTDDDGMLDGWEVDNALDPLHDDASADFDGDGVINAFEHVAGTRANDITDYFHIAATEVIAGASAISWQTVSGRLYSVHSSTNLLAPYWITNLYRRAGDGGQMSYTNSPGIKQLFLQLEVEYIR